MGDEVDRSRNPAKHWAGGASLSGIPAYLKVSQSSLQKRRSGSTQGPSFQGRTKASIPNRHAWQENRWQLCYSSRKVCMGWHQSVVKNGCTFGQHVSRKASKIAFTFDFPDEWWIRKIITGNWIRLAISCSPLTFCEIAEVFALMPSTNTTANIMKGYERGPVQRNELWGHPQKMLEPNVEAKKKYVNICIYMNCDMIFAFLLKM